MQRSHDQAHALFEHWLRTGRILQPIEYKFNGWHSTEDGTFTQVGNGRFFPRGSGQAGERARRPSPALGKTWRGGGFTGGGGGSFGGGGATGPGWETPEERAARERTRRPAGGGVPPARTAGIVARSPESNPRYTLRKGDTLTEIAEKEGMTVAQIASANSISTPDRITAGATLIIPARSGSQAGWVSVRVNRLTFEIDPPGRTRIAEGQLANAPDQRSKRLQASAGKPDRLLTDDGGHIIAPRFGGPKAAYNHFAQNANFNRGEYRKLEDHWAALKRNGQDVSVEIDIAYPASSRRPSEMIVTWKTDTMRKTRAFYNVSGGRRD